MSKIKIPNRSCPSCKTHGSAVFIYTGAAKGRPWLVNTFRCLSCGQEHSVDATPS